MNPDRETRAFGAFLDALAARGRGHFTTAEAIEALPSSAPAVRASLRRARERGRLATPVRGFHVLVPPEYRALGCSPADHFVPQLMRHLQLPYYAGLLTAAAYHGAAHQAPMIFQVVVAASRPAIRCGRVHVQFIARRNVEDIPAIDRNTPRGILRVSTPEATAFDLAGYPGHCGGLSNVATILKDLAAQLRPEALLDLAAHSPLPWLQRLGHLLDHALDDESEYLTAGLARRVNALAKEYVPLRPGSPAHDARRDTRWRVLVNEAVEADG